MTQSALVDHLSRPIRHSRISTPSRDSGAFRGSINNWLPRRNQSQIGEDAERKLTQDRAEDLYANDFAAKSSVDAIALNAVGTGLTPQPRIPFKKLGITEEEAYDVKEQMEWNWHIWCQNAHATGPMHFEDLQYSGIKSLLRSGEMLHLPVMRKKTSPLRPFSLAIQPLSPKRLRTPSDLATDPYVRDGIRLSPDGEPVGYYIAAPEASAWSTADYTDASYLTSEAFRYIPAKIGHRPGIFHLYRFGDEEEQVRGVSSLSTAAKLYRSMADAIDYELLAQIIAAAFPVFIGLEGGKSGLPEEVLENMGILARSERSTDMRYHQTVEPGTMVYGNANEKPYILESKRPSQNFMAFEELVLRGAFASQGLSLESGMKNFSKANYSVVRAAMNEDWKTYRLYRSLFDRHDCHPTYIMVQEEAYLRGMLTLPAKAPDFYEALHFWTNAYWYGPSRGYVDPVKEIQANLMAIANRLMTRTEHFAEHGGDFAEAMDQIEAEELRLASMPGQPSAVSVSKSVKTVDPAQTQPAEDADEADDAETEDSVEEQ